jgi:hypothetical protein
MDGVIELPSQTDLPAGATFKCMECGTRLRRGQPHTALAPRPHQTVSLLIATHATDDGLREYVGGSHAGITGYREPLRPQETHSRYHSPSMGRVITGWLVQGPDLLWREVVG